MFWDIGSTAEEANSCSSLIFLPTSQEAAGLGRTTKSPAKSGGASLIKYLESEQQLHF
jgi:hypothetical protein